ncbi:transmembrane protein 42 [Andrena cerasifolii]|uniref:transmembrane protein 42 n=1 Tax=Andrena cerasifolii TaxID=2819439 RepID=UPI0040383998
MVLLRIRYTPVSTYTSFVIVAEPRFHIGKVESDTRLKTKIIVASRALRETDPSFSSAEGKVQLAVVAGLFATIGSLLGKLAGGVELDSVVALLLKGVLLILMVTSNTVGCTFFVKALNASGSSLPCTIASAATSYVCSALAGFLIFGESTSVVWWCGISLVILGLLFICRAPKTGESAEKSKKQ